MSDESWRGRVGRLDEAEISTFLAEAHLARLACLDDEGWPHVVPCWHEWDGSSFWVIPREKSAWARYLATTLGARSASTNRKDYEKSSRSAPPTWSRSRTSAANGCLSPSA